MILADPPVLALFKRLIEPFLLLGLLYLCIVANGRLFTGNDLLLMIIVFFVSSFVYEQIEAYRNLHRQSGGVYARDVFAGWLAIVCIVGLIGNATGLGDLYSPATLVPWIISTPFSLLLCRRLAQKLDENWSRTSVARTAAIVGVNDAGADLYARIASNSASGIELHGFFDDRNAIRGAPGFNERRIGQLADIAPYVRRHHINLVFISMPMFAQPRLLALLDELKDTTASIYFIPDMRNFETMQAHVDDVHGLPLFGVCESPFTGFNGVIKRCSDVILATLILLVFAPLMALVVIGIKMTSPGPIIFAQRRYGLDGKEITIYKFRSMAVCEDGDEIVQARKHDARVTPFGGFLRRTSLDELPQLFNVLQGRMSIVGPRPHAVAHNELYRGLIKGYMLRHKVKPGITGWAQVNGCRGETETLEKMQARIEYDLSYLRNWSLVLDLWIIVRTVTVVMKRENAY